MPGLRAAVALTLAFHILGYHEVDPKPRSGWGMDTQTFLDQMELVAATEHHVVPLSEVADYLAGRIDSLPPHALVITVDDGFACAYSEIAPVLQRFRYPFTLFIYTAMVGKGEHALTWAQIAELQRGGADIESHTTTHPHLMHRSHPEMTDAAYATWLHEELADARADVEAHTGQPVRFLAYPYGDHDAAVQTEAANDGYVLALTSESGANTRSVSPLALYRIVPDAAMTLDQFAAAIGLGALQLTDANPPQGGIAAATFTATIANRQRLDPSSVHVVLLGDATTRGTYDPLSGRVSLTLPPRPESRETVVVWADDAQTGQRLAAIETLYASPADRDRDLQMRASLAALPLHHASPPSRAPQMQRR